MQNPLFILLLSSLILTGNALTLSAQTWTEIQQLTHTDSAVSDKFGFSLALEENLAAIGVPRNDTNSSLFSGDGSVAIWEYVPLAGWTLKQQLAITQANAVPGFGWDLALDDSTLMVSAYADALDAAGLNELNAAGAVYVYHPDISGNWQMFQKLTAADRSSNDYFGWAIHSHDDRMIVGARYECHNALGLDSLAGAGSAYIFERQAGGNWQQAQKLVAADRAPDDSFGSAVSIRGNYTFVGAWLEDHNAAGTDSLEMAGSVYVFHRSTGGIWVQMQKLVSPDRAAQEFFGCTIALGDSIAMIGCYGDGEDSTGGNYMPTAGAVYVFRIDPAGNWGFSQKIVASDRSIADAFGNSIALDGGRAIIGAFQDNPVGTPLGHRHGSGYVFEEDGTGHWTEKQKLTASNSADPDRFGHNLALQGDRAMIGAPYRNAERGAAYAFEYTAAVGVAEPTAPNFQIYPNPSTDGVFTLIHPANEGGGYAEVSDSAGRLIGRHKLPTGTKTLIPVEGKGLFFVTLKLNGSQVTQKIVVL